MSEYHPALERLEHAIDRVEYFITAQQPAAKSAADIEALVAQYESDIGDAIDDLQQKKIKQADFEERVRNILADAALLIFLAGSDAAQADLTVDDQARIGGWIDEQAQYIAGLGTAAIEAATASAAGDTAKQAALVQRIGAWGDTLTSFGQIASITATNDPPLIYDGNDGAESCDECQVYKGQVHPASWWRERGLLERNGNPHYSCGRWSHCDHHFYHARTGELVIN